MINLAQKQVSTAEQKAIKDLNFEKKNLQIVNDQMSDLQKQQDNFLHQNAKCETELKMLADYESLTPGQKHRVIDLETQMRENNLVLSRLREQEPDIKHSIRLSTLRLEQAQQCYRDTQVKQTVESRIPQPRDVLGLTRTGMSFSEKMAFREKFGDSEYENLPMI